MMRLFFAAFFLPLGLFAAAPTVPFCETFDGSPILVPSWWVGTNVRRLEIKWPDNSGNFANRFLASGDDSGSSFVTGAHANLTGTKGDWMAYLNTGKCLKLCWDVKLIRDGELNNDISTKPAIRLIGPKNGAGVTLLADFIVHERITDDVDDIPNTPFNPGWHTYCAPVRPLSLGGALPTSTVGVWKLSHTGAVMADWNLILANVKGIRFAIDINSTLDEQWGWDNICLTEDDCPDCLEITNVVATPSSNGAGGWNYAVGFTLTNNSTAQAASVHVPSTATVPSTPVVSLSPLNQFIFLNSGASTTVTVNLAGAQPGSRVCFPLWTRNSMGNEICRTTFCVDLPCVKTNTTSLVARAGVPGDALWNATLTNYTLGPLGYVQFFSPSQSVGIAPALISLNNLAAGATMTLPQITLSRLTPDTTMTFHAIVYDANFNACCIDTFTLSIPSNVGYGNPPPAATWTVTNATPATAGAPGVSASPDGCVLISDEVIGKPVGTPPCWRYTFTITNKTGSPMTHLLIPRSTARPQSIVFTPALANGFAKRIAIDLCDETIGTTAQVPLVLANPGVDKCCGIMRPVAIINDQCIEIAEQVVTCNGVDEFGNIRYAWSVTFKNISGVTMQYATFGVESWETTSFSPNPVLINDPVPNNSYAGATSYFIVPVGTKKVDARFGLKNASMTVSCEIEQTLTLPDCCDCDVTWAWDDNFTGDFSNDPVITFINLEEHPNLGYVHFKPVTTPLPYVVVPNITRGTIVRVNAATGAVVGEYRSTPETRTDAQPRVVAVDQFGEAWIGNGNDDKLISGTNYGSVVRIGLVIGGTRGNVVSGSFVPNASGTHLRGPFTYISPSVQDRDGDGYLRTSLGLTDVRRWDQALAGTNDNGGVSAADDELVTDYVRTVPWRVRSLVINRDNDVWIGGVGVTAFQRLNGQTAGFGTATAMPGGAAAVLDSRDVLWSLQMGAGVHRLNLNTTARSFSTGKGAGFLALDGCSGNVWSGTNIRINDSTAPLISDYYIRRWASTGAQNLVMRAPGSIGALNVNRDSKLWGTRAVSNAGPKLWALTSSGSVTTPHVTSASIAGPGGVGLDHAGNAWMLDYGRNQLLHIDTGTRVILQTVSLNNGAGPFAPNSDPTGMNALSATAHHGSMTWIYDSLCADGRWGQIDWQTLGRTSVPNQSDILVEIRATNDRLNPPRQWHRVENGKAFCSKNIVGRYLHLRVRFIRDPQCTPLFDPKLLWLRARCCDELDLTSPAGENNAIVDHPDGTLTNPATVSVFVHDEHELPLVGQWFIDNAPGPMAEESLPGHFELTPALEAGVHQVELRITNGTTPEERFLTTVNIGDQLAPTITAPFGSSEAAFAATLPDFRPLSTVSDNATPSGEITLTQTPPPGSALAQGVHEITLTATDATSHSSTAKVFFTVDPVISVNGVTEGQVITQGSSVSVTPSIAAGGPFDLVLNGQFIGSSNGEPLPLSLPVGPHTLQWQAHGPGNTLSLSDAISVWVKRPINVPTLAISTTSPGNFALQFDTQTDTENCLQQSTDLTTWSDVLIINGTGGSVNQPITDSGLKKFFRVCVQSTE